MNYPLVTLPYSISKMQQIVNRSIESDFYHVSRFDKKLKSDYVYHPDHHLYEQFQQVQDELCFLPERLVYSAMKDVESGLPLDDVVKQTKKYHQEAFLCYLRKGLEIAMNPAKELTKEMLTQLKTGYIYMYPYFPMQVDPTGLARGD